MNRFQKLGKISWRSLPEKQLRAELTRLNSVANKRIKRLEQAGETNSPAYQYAANYTQDINSRLQNRFRNDRNASYPELEIEMKYVMKFLNSVTSTVKGIKDSINKSMKAFNKRFNPSSKASVSDIYRVFETENWKTLKQGLDKFSCIRVVDLMVETLSEGKSTQDINKFISDALNDPNPDKYLIDVMESFESYEEDELDLWRALGL